MAEQIYDSNGNLVDAAVTKEATDKKCPQCDGIMAFDPASGGLKCPFCGHVEKVALAAAIDEETNEVVYSAAELRFEDAEKTGNCDWGVATKTIICKSCGGEAVYDALQISGTCPYCGSRQVTEANDENTLAPGGVCPFKVTKQDAGVRFKKWLGSKWYAPKEAKQSAQAEAFNGLYLPYWTFDADTVSNYKGEYGIDREVTDSDGDSHTETDWYKTSGVYSEFIDDQLIMGTNRHNREVLSMIEPFNTADNVIYKPEYISGYATERYAVGLKDGWEVAKKSITSRLKNNITKKILKEKAADHVANLKFSTQYNDIRYKYLLLPVWTSAFTYKGKIYEFMVNGQTGKVGGKYPISAGKVILTIAIILVILFVLFCCFGGGELFSESY